MKILHDIQRTTDRILTCGKRMDVGRCGRREDLRDGSSRGDRRREQLPRSRHLRVTTSELEAQRLRRLRVELHSALRHKQPTHSCSVYLISSHKGINARTTDAQLSWRLS